MGNSIEWLITKTRYLAGLQCLRRLWREVNESGESPEVDPATRFRMEMGRKVGRVACQMFSDGIAVHHGNGFDQHLQESRELLKRRKPLFEAGFLCKNTYARTDILLPGGKGGCDLVEVKSSTAVREDHLHDVSFQRYVCEQAGLKIGRCVVMVVNNQYVRTGQLDPAELLVEQDVTEKVASLLDGIDGKVERMARVLSRKKPPGVSIGPHCFTPYECPFITECCGSPPGGDSVMNLVGDRKLSFALVNEGITSLAKIPAAWLRNPKQLVQVRAHRQKKAHVDRNAIRRFLDSIQYPAFFLDLETVGSPIPLYDRTRPWEHVPFQFSLRIVRRKGAEPVHHVYLADGKADPRPEILKRLRTLLGDKGSIIAYNATFEKNCLEKAAEAYPSNAGWFRRNRERFLDLLQPFREFAYYSPKQGGSTSLKNVLPALTGRDPYEGLAIADGGVAGAEFCRVTFESGISDEERQRVREALEKYCGIDTAGMVEIVAALRKAASA